MGQSRATSWGKDAYFSVPWSAIWARSTLSSYMKKLQASEWIRRDITEPVVQYGSMNSTGRERRFNIPNISSQGNKKLSRIHTNGT